MRRNEALQVDRVVDLWNGEENNVFRTRRRVQDAIEDWLQQHEAKRLEKSDRREQHYPGNQLHQEGEYVAD